MAIAHYLKEIGRGKDGSTHLSRAEAQDAMQQVLSGGLDRIELGAFCMAMRVKGETTDEFAGFLDAIHTSGLHVQHDCKLVVLPSYNGSRKLPNLTPLLALLLAQAGKIHGFGVLVHGHQTESRRIDSAAVFGALSNALTTQNDGSGGDGDDCPRPRIASTAPDCTVQAGQVLYTPLELLHPSLTQVLGYRSLMGVRNSAHSLVKLMRPCTQPEKSLLLTCYTHPEYLISMGKAITATQTHALLLRGTEGEAVADPRRMPRMDCYLTGSHQHTHAAQKGSIAQPPALPDRAVADTTQYTLDVLRGTLPTPANLLRQVEVMCEQMAAIPA